MIKTIQIFALTLLAFTIQAQQDVEIIKVKNADRSVDISAHNHSNIDWDLSVDALLIGMKMEKPINNPIRIKAGEKVKVAKLVATADVTKYKLNYSLVGIDKTKPSNQYYDEPNVVIYTENSQERSTMLRIYLDKHNIPFGEVNVSYNEQTKKQFDNMLLRRGIKPEEARLPVVNVDGEIYHKIDDMMDFMKSKLPKDK